MPRILGELNTAPGLQEQISLINSLRTMIGELHTSTIISNTRSSFRRHMTDTLTSHIGQKVWFHRKRHGLQPDSISRIERPTISVFHSNKLLPTHEIRLRRYLDQSSLPIRIASADNKKSSFMEKGHEDEPHQEDCRPFEKAPAQMNI